jgi:hypothetical protein
MATKVSGQSTKAIPNTEEVRFASSKSSKTASKYQPISTQLDEHFLIEDNEHHLIVTMQAKSYFDRYYPVFLKKNQNLAQSLSKSDQDNKQIKLLMDHKLTSPLTMTAALHSKNQLHEQLKAYYEQWGKFSNTLAKVEIFARRLTRKIDILSPYNAESIVVIQKKLESTGLSKVEREDLELELLQFKRKDEAYINYWSPAASLQKSMKENLGKLQEQGDLSRSYYKKMEEEISKLEAAQKKQATSTTEETRTLEVTPKQKEDSAKPADLVIASSSAAKKTEEPPIVTTTSSGIWSYFYRSSASSAPSSSSSSSSSESAATVSSTGRTSSSSSSGSSSTVSSSSSSNTNEKEDFELITNLTFSSPVSSEVITESTVLSPASSKVITKSTVSSPAPSEVITKSTVSSPAPSDDPAPLPSSSAKNKKFRKKNQKPPKINGQNPKASTSQLLKRRVLSKTLDSTSNTNL